jgi:hypothetical protein
MAGLTRLLKISTNRNLVRQYEFLHLIYQEINQSYAAPLISSY